MRLADDSVSSETISAEQVRKSLELLLSSNAFAGAERIKAFLTYIVEEELAGRGDQIRAKRIATDVYNRSVSGSVEKNALVRVDAGRLRRRLELYYADKGRAETLRIEVKRGGYRPIFEKVSNDEPTLVPVKSHWTSTRILVSAGVLCAVIVFAVIFVQIRIDTGETISAVPATPSTHPKEVERQAVFDQSPAALQASSLVDEARELTFPPLSPVRLKAAIELCRLAIELAPNYYGGHSCSARAIAFLAFFTDSGPARKNLTAKASAMAARAVEIDPTRANAQSARSWVMFVDGYFNRAVEAGRQAVFLNPDNRSAWNYSAMMTIFNGDGREVLLNTGLPQVEEQLEQIYHPFILVGAKFQIGSYSEAIRHVGRAASETGHASALITSILAASHFEIGNRKKAAELVKKLGQFWPGRRFEREISKFYRHPKDANQIISRIYKIDPKLKLATE